MSAELVGFENLPNVFIKEVSVYDYSQTEIEVKVSLILHDLKDSPVWYDTSEFLTQLLQIGVVFSDNLQQSNQISSGELKPEKLVSMSKAIPKMQVSGDNYIFEVSFSKVFPKTIQNLNVYSFCYIGKEKLLQHLGIVANESYYGPIKAERVFESGLISPNSFAFSRKNGSYWSGPVHMSSDGNYMMGSYHDEKQPETLTRITIKNIKIKDHRGQINKSNTKSLEVKNIISDLSVSYNSSTDINAIFMVNIKSLLKNKTKNGRFLERASSKVTTELLNNFKISLLSIQRQRIKMLKTPSFLRSKQEKVEKILSKKSLIKTYDTQNGIKQITRLERNGIFDISENEIRSNSDKLTRKQGEIFREEIGSYKKTAKITELFMEYGQEIRTFQFNDYELTDKTPGKYRYTLEMSFVDPIEQFLNRVTVSMNFDMSEIKKYITLISRKRDLTKSGIDYQGLVDSYIEKYSYIYELSSQQMRVLTNKFLNLVSPASVTMETIKKFESEYMNLKTEYSKILEFDKEKKKISGRKTSISSKDFLTKRIFFQTEFKTLVEPSENDVGFGYFEDNNSDMMKVFSKRDIINRGEEETKKNFLSTPNLKSKSLNPKISQALSDIFSKQTSFFAPKFIKNSKKNHKFDLDSSVPHETINKALRRKDLKTSSKRRKITNFITRPPKIPTQIEDTTEQFVGSSDSLGKNSEFVKYDDSFDSYNVVEKTSEAEIKIQNLNSGFQNDRKFSEIIEKTKILTEEQAYMLPNQLKAVIAGQTDSTRTDYVSTNGDLLASPNTKNYYEVNNFSVKSLMYIDGFMRDKNNNILLNKPVFKETSVNNLNTLNKPVICKLQSYTNNLFRIEENNVNPVNSIFVLSDKDITVKTSEQTNQTRPNYNVQSITYEFMNSEIVMQTNNKISVKIS
jgi:hypothetical protein